MPSKEIERLVKLRSGRVTKVAFRKVRAQIYFATNENGNVIRVINSGIYWSASNGTGKTYHHVNPAIAFSNAANDFWK